MCDSVPSKPDALNKNIDNMNANNFKKACPIFVNLLFSLKIATITTELVCRQWLRDHLSLKRYLGARIRIIWRSREFLS